MIVWRKGQQRGLADGLLLGMVVLAALAVPAYQDYKQRRYTDEGLALASGIQFPVLEYYDAHDRFPQGTVGEIHRELGLAAPELISGRATQSVSVLSGGRIEVRYNELVQKGGIVILTPRVSEYGGGAVIWTCTSPNIEPRKLPPECRP